MGKPAVKFLYLPLFLFPMDKRLKELLSSKDFPFSEDDVEISEELVIDLEQLSQSHDVIRIKMPKNSVIGEVDTGSGREMVIYRGLNDAAC